jgi:hypothetical protein
MHIFSGNNLALSVDVYAPKPTADAWNIEVAGNDKGAFTLEGIFGYVGADYIL